MLETLELSLEVTDSPIGHVVLNDPLTVSLHPGRLFGWSGVEHSGWVAAMAMARLRFQQYKSAVDKVAQALAMEQTGMSIRGDYPKHLPQHRERWDNEQAIHARLLRDIFGNPFRAVTLDPSWLTSTVLALAAGIYNDRAFDRMPILADALQDAGCDNEEILNHCRQAGEHCRGCWVVDLILSKC